MGGFLSYRKNIRSRNEPSLGENLPPNRLEKLKEWQVIGEGNMMIDHKKRMITTKFINYFKIDESEADSIKNIYKQNKIGFFETVLIKKYNNGIEKILYKK
ncbi:hypothetical protein [Chryseobacterium sp. C3]|uniref:hypothetical protein n=1 Tax=Chryseobacterium sp. C3 TaxID=2761532 RepID=UPI0016280640|nr:hypothetical protein [Chryseobacterium sp. C3]